jgi:enoyl-CoA hydratase/carnithine racemase
MNDLKTYADRFQTVKLHRAEGILQMTLHTDGGPLKWGKLPHAELADAFLCVAQDRENQVVIITGTGDEYSGPRVTSSEDNRSHHKVSAEQWAELAVTGKNLLFNLLRIDVPMISAVNGPAVRHAEIPVMCDIVLASENALFQDSAHFSGGLVPGDGVHVVFPLVMGLNRGRYFLLTGQVLDAREAKDMGLVNEVLPREQLMPRAWELARQLMKQPEINRRYARLLLTERLRRQMHELLPYGLALESFAGLQ